MNNESTRPSIVSRASEAGHHLWQEVAPRVRRRPLVWVGGTLAVVVVLFLVFRPAAAPQQGRGGGRFGGGGPQPVATAAATKGDIPITLNALGTIVPLATVTVRGQIAGVLTQVAFQEGQFVHEGDLLALVDPRPSQHALEQAEGQLQRDQALLKNAQLDAARYKLLFEQDSIAKQQLDTQNALVLQYKGTVQTDQGQVDTARLNLNYCYIKAPITGRVGLRLVDQGNYVSVGDTNGIAVITQMQPITAIFTVPEDSLRPVLQRLRQGMTLPVTAYDRGLKAKLATGAVTTIDNQIDTTTGTIKLRAQFENKDESLFPNQFVNISLLVDTVKDSTVVPASAVQRGAPGTFVYLINKPDAAARERARMNRPWWQRLLAFFKFGNKKGNGQGWGGAEDEGGPTVAIRPIKLGPSAGEQVAVESGLAVGDLVVTDGADRLKDGAKVILTKQGDGEAAPADGKSAVKAPDGSQQPAAASSEHHWQSGEQHHHRRQGNSDGEAPSAGGAPGGTPPAGGSP